MPFLSPLTVYKTNEEIGNTTSKIFHTNQGVKQGCILSLLHFNIFLTDFQQEIHETENEPALISQNEKLGWLHTMGRRHTSDVRISKQDSRIC